MGADKLSRLRDRFRTGAAEVAAERAPEPVLDPEAHPLGNAWGDAFKRLKKLIDDIEFQAEAHGADDVRDAVIAFDTVYKSQLIETLRAPRGATAAHKLHEATATVRTKR